MKGISIYSFLIDGKTYSLNNLKGMYEIYEPIEGRINTIVTLNTCNGIHTEVLYMRLSEFISTYFLKEN